VKLATFLNHLVITIKELAMKPFTRSALIKGMNKKFPGVWTREGEFFNGSKGAIWTGEGSSMPNEDEAFNHYRSDFEMGIHPELYTYLNDRGWHCEWHDGGTILIYKN
jgi:hypothetical protein